MADPNPPAETVQASSSWPTWETPFKSSLPLLTKILAASILVVSIVSFDFGSLNNPLPRVFGLVPGNTISRFYLWNVLTSALYHHNPLDLVVNLFLLIFAIRYLEQFWGTTEFGKFFAFVTGLSGLSSLFVYIMLYIATHEEDYMFPKIPFGGFGAFTAGSAVALKQLLPDYEVRVFGLVGLRGKQVPALLLIWSLLAALAFLPVTSLPLALFGFMYAWLYLRFLQKREGVTGDSSEQFSVASFFPEAVQPPIRIISNIVYAICCCCCPKKTGPAQPRHLDQATFLSLGTMPSVLDQPQDAERRRQVGLKALDARLASIKSSPATKVASQAFGGGGNTAPQSPSSPSSPSSSQTQHQTEGDPNNV